MLRICRFALCTLAVLAGNIATADDVPPAPKWLREVTRVAYTDLPNRDRLGDWPDKFIADLAASKAQLLFSRCHSGEGWKGLAWRSQFGDADPAMGDRDGTREVLALCRKHGLRYIPYYWAQREPAALAETHPEWRCVNARGNKTGYFCVNTPYRQLVQDRVVELVAKVGVDGVFFDMFHARADECYCHACKAKFRKMAGVDPPLKEDFQNRQWQQWANFKYNTIEDALREINRAMKAANPEAALVVNSWNAWVIRNPHNTRNSIRVAECVDGLLEETGWYDSVDPSFYAFPALHNFMSWHLAGLCKNKAPLMWSSPSYLGAQSIGYPEAAIRVATIITNGAIPAQSVPDRDVMHRYMADLDARQEFTRGSSLDPWCGMVVSEKTELWYGRDDPKNRYLKGVLGAYQALLERHLPVTMVTDRELELGKLEPYRVLFLPNTAAMSDAEMETVRKFVRGGGGVVATYETSLYDEHAKAREQLGLADLFGAKRAGELDTCRVRFSWAETHSVGASLYLPATHPWRKDPVLSAALSLSGATSGTDFFGQSLPLHCRMALVDAQGPAASPLRIHTAETDRKANQTKRGNHAALVESTFGKGRVVYLPADLTWAYFRYGRDYVGRIIELCLRQAASQPPRVEAAAPSIVQAMTHVQNDRLVVHLLNDISSLGRAQNVAGESTYERREAIPIHDVRLVFRDKSLRKIRLVPGAQTLPVVDKPDGLEVVVPRLDIHALVVTEREPGASVPSQRK